MRVLDFSGRRDRSIKGFLREQLVAVRTWHMLADRTEVALFLCALLLLFASALFGGASATNALAQAAVELACLPLLFLSLHGLLKSGPPTCTALPMILLALILAVPVLQLVPLPPAIWTRLPERAVALDVLNATHIGPRALPLSLTPEATWRGLLALLPPAAMFLGSLQLSESRRRFMVGCWLALATLSMLIGALQMLGGPDSPFYFYEITNLGSPVGLFANRNHQAALLLCLIPLAALVATRLKGGWGDIKAFVGVLAVLYLPLAIVGVVVTLSRAGILLLGAALLSAVAIAMRTGLWRRRWRTALGASVVAAASVGAVLTFGLTPILERFGQPDDLRFEAWPLVLKTANSYLPLGSGIGSFDTVYRSVEPLTQVGPNYFNHAHNDFLELWLETGVLGAALLIIFGVWFVRRSVELWQERKSSARTELAAASTLVTFLLLAHSTVDYPLRTESLAVLFAFCCAAIATAPLSKDSIKSASTDSTAA